MLHISPIKTTYPFSKLKISEIGTACSKLLWLTTAAPLHCPYPVHYVPFINLHNLCTHWKFQEIQKTFESPCISTKWVKNKRRYEYLKSQAHLSWWSRYCYIATISTQSIGILNANGLGKCKFNFLTWIANYNWNNYFFYLLAGHAMKSNKRVQLTANGSHCKRIQIISRI